jgi:TRAP transporter TAXI family solute receptor
MNQYSNYTLIVQPSPTPEADVAAVHEKAADISIQASLAVYAKAFNDSTVFPAGKDYELRAILGAHLTFFTWFAGADTGIKTIADLKGHKVHWKTPGLQYDNWPVALQSLRSVGLDPKKDVQHVDFSTSADAAKALADGKIDAFWASIHTTYIEEADAKRPLVMLPYPREAYETITPPLLKNAWVFRELPVGYRLLVRKQIPCVGFVSVVFCRDELPDEVAYQVAKVTMEHFTELQAVHPVFKDCGVWENQLPDNFLIPYHNGAIRYFKEAGKWNTANEAHQKELVEQIQKLMKSS